MAEIFLKTKERYLTQYYCFIYDFTFWSHTHHCVSSICRWLWLYASNVSETRFSRAFPRVSTYICHVLCNNIVFWFTGWWRVSARSNESSSSGITKRRKGAHSSTESVEVRCDTPGNKFSWGKSKTKVLELTLTDNVSRIMIKGLCS